MPDATDLTAAAAALGITLDPAWLPAVQFHLELSLQQARLVAEFPLPDEADPAPVFQA
ncbi:MAG: DUF4089 domain-containing protein [Gemmatimonadaceae bacterium]|nr:DUF4089 domain-containing protein [Acetobacteraceae bacterium]